jgi:hypothetical protein
MPCAASQRASQKPSCPASNATVLFLYNLVALQIALERGQRVGRDRLTLGRA